MYRQHRRREGREEERRRDRGTAGGRAGPSVAATANGHLSSRPLSLSSQPRPGPRGAHGRPRCISADAAQLLQAHVALSSVPAVTPRSGQRWVVDSGQWALGSGQQRAVRSLGSGSRLSPSRALLLLPYRTVVYCTVLFCAVLHCTAVYRCRPQPPGCISVFPSLSAVVRRGTVVRVGCAALCSAGLRTGCTTLLQCPGQHRPSIVAPPWSVDDIAPSLPPQAYPSSPPRLPSPLPTALSVRAVFHPLSKLEDQVEPTSSPTTRPHGTAPRLSLSTAPWRSSTWKVRSARPPTLHCSCRALSGADR